MITIHSEVRGQHSCFHLVWRRLHHAMAFSSGKESLFFKIHRIFEEDTMFAKPRPRFLMVTFSFMSIVILALSACSAQGTPTPPTTTGKPVQGGTWIDDIPNEPGSLIPNGDSQTFDV